MHGDVEEIATFAAKIRRHALCMVHRAGASHIGSCLSMADLLAAFYCRTLKVDANRPDWPGRDRFVLSKGHGAAILYAALAERGFFPLDWLDRYCTNGSPLTGHVNHLGVPGVEVSTGSLGHGLSIGCGMALAGRAASVPFRCFVLLSDGECDEGSTWEAALFAPHHRLGNLTAIVDYNKIQSFGDVADVLSLEPLADKWRAFGWKVLEIDGHDLVAINAALGSVDAGAERPLALIAHTVKGKGVSFMENELLWHYRNPDADQLASALQEVGGE